MLLTRRSFVQEQVKVFLPMILGPAESLVPANAEIGFEPVNGVSSPPLMSRVKFKAHRAGTVFAIMSELFPLEHAVIRPRPDLPPEEFVTELLGARKGWIYSVNGTIYEIGADSLTVPADTMIEWKRVN